MKYIKAIVFMIVLLFACVFTVNSYAEESSFQCNTNPELIQEMNNALIQKKAKEYNPWSEKIQLFQIGSLWSDKLMPSTGDVKVLVVPIEFANEKLENTICDRLQEVYFSEKDLTNNQLTYSDLSFCDYYKKESFEDDLLHVMDIHSHNFMKAYFSTTDDADEKATRLYTVIGRLDKMLPDILTRISVGGKFEDIHPSEIFEYPFGDFPNEWLDNVTEYKVGGVFGENQ